MKHNITLITGDGTGPELSEAMKILFFMAKDGEIDIDIIRFFYESGLYLRYARDTLLDENIDEVILDFNHKEKI
jgi:isocitrate/isopropylmalate dehydrogenase